MACSLPPRGFREVFLYMGCNLHQQCQIISKLMSKLKLHGKHCELSYIQLYCMHGFMTNICIFHYCTRPIRYFLFYKSNYWQIRAVNQQRHTNLQLIQNLQCQTYVFFCLCVVRKATAHFGIKVLNIRHQ